MPEINNVLTIILNAAFTGFGVAIGSYLANRTLFENIKKLIEKSNKIIKIKK